ncbi:tetratricopeptide repeat protein 16 [Cygnus atratus]|uniref:tetratricopeptide repeat protein 16 n=1 Tax=Cygnus atratus TaxID=8868 RepID=UPI0021B7D125|nr:tetratricopeptide repeat protein 16 [Cygnus atratus]
MRGTRSSISPEPSSSSVCILALPSEPSFLQTLTGSTISAFGSESLGLAHGSFPLRSWQKGMEFSSCGQWEEAIICYTKAISLDPQRAELYEQRAEAFLQRCDFQSATLNFRKVLALGPAREQHCLARLALVLDLQFPECLQMLNRDLAEDARNPDLYVLHASFYERFGQIRPLRSLRDPGSSSWRWGMQVEAPGPEGTRPPWQLALCHQDIQRALQLEPQHGAAQALQQRLRRQGLEAKAEAVSKALCGDLRGALLTISFAIETNPLAAEFFTLRGALLRRLKDFSAACKDLAKARQLCADEGPEAQEAQLVLTYNDCAVDCYTLGRLDETVMLLGQALQDERTEEGLCVNRGDCFLCLGELAHALADYQQALELSPGNLGVQRRVAAALHELALCELLSPHRRYQQAEARFSAAIEHDPQAPLHYLHRAQARLCLRRVQSAREDAVRSLRLDPTDSEILSLTHHLFPRKTVQAILRSETGHLAQETLEKTLQSPPEPPVSADDAWCDSTR